MKMKNEAAFMTEVKKIVIREVPLPEPKEGQVLIRLDYVGVCGSDLHFFDHGRIGNCVVKGDFILGHECAGTVVGVGPGVSSHSVGDRVALEPGITCGHCTFCTSGHYNLCPDVEFLATPPYHGCLSRYIVFPAPLAFKLPDNVSSREGALIEPLCVGLETASVAGIKPGDRVVILGGGCIGLTAMLASKLYGAVDVVVVDVIEKRLQKALELGANKVINASHENVIEEIAKYTNGQGMDVVIEAAGAAKTIQQAVDLVRRGGVITMVGLAPENIIPFDFSKLMDKVAEIKPIFRYKNQYPVAIKALASGKIDVSGIISDEYVFEDVEKAFCKNSEEKSDVVKILIRF